MPSSDAVIIEPSQHHSASVIWLHGLGADGHDFESIVPELDLDDLGVRFIFPHAPKMPITINGGMTMRAWYDVRSPDLTQMEDADTIKVSAKIIRTFIDAEVDKGIPSERILLAGFSQGGAIALYTGLRFAQPLAGLLALSTYLPLQNATESEVKPSNQAIDILQMHGTFDPVIPLLTARNSFYRMQEFGLNIDWKEYPIPHSLCGQQVKDIADWIRQQLSG